MQDNSLAPVAGVTLQKYAELAVKMRGVSTDREACALIAEREGVKRKAWEQALVAWNARIGGDDATDEVTLAYYKHYREALARHALSGGTVTFEAYVEMSAMLRTEAKRPTGAAAMCEAFGITLARWTETSRVWTAKLVHDPQMFATYLERVQARVRELDAIFLRRGSA